MTRSENAQPPPKARKRQLTEERRVILRFTCVWLASLAFLALAWSIHPAPHAGDESALPSRTAELGRAPAPAIRAELPGLTGPR